MLVGGALACAPPALGQGDPPEWVESRLGDGVCLPGYSLATLGDIAADPAGACRALTMWAIARIADGGAMDGFGYGCGTRATDEREIGGSLCKLSDAAEVPNLESEGTFHAFRWFGDPSKVIVPHDIVQVSRPRSDRKTQVVPGLADPSLISIRALRGPAREPIYVQTLPNNAQGLARTLEAPPDAEARATFRVVPGLASPTDPRYVSLESYDLPGVYLARCARQSLFLCAEADDGADEFHERATFEPFPALPSDEDEPQVATSEGDTSDEPPPDLAPGDDPVTGEPPLEDDPGDFIADDPEPGRMRGVTAAHNAWRAVVGQTDVTWSATIAAQAQAYADQLAAAGTCHTNVRGIPPHSDQSTRGGVLQKSAGAYTGCPDAEKVEGLCLCQEDTEGPHGTLCGPYTLGRADGSSQTYQALFYERVAYTDCAEADKVDGYCTCDPASTTQPPRTKCKPDGENMYSQGGSADGPVSYFSAVDGVDWWGLEKLGYDIRRNLCPGGVCGHYTQVVWDKTTQIGCGVATCGEVVGLGEFASNSRITVCRYRPGGNNGRRPYERSADQELTVDLFAVKDTSLRSDAVNQNEGANKRLYVADDKRALVGFSPAAGTVGDNLEQAKLRLKLKESSGWGNAGEPVDVHVVPRIPDGWRVWREGDASDFGLAADARQAGSGDGATWNCGRDSEIANATQDCFEPWAGAIGGAQPYQPATAAAATHSSGQTGAVAWDVTTDAKAGANEWLVRKTTENGGGVASYFSGEVRRTNRAPRLRLKIVGTD